MARLPANIYQACIAPFAHHAVWHTARHPDWSGFAKARKVFPNIKLINQAGTGEEFLRFHRMMVREFKWIVANTAGPAYAYEPWPALADFVVQSLDQDPPDYVAGAVARIAQLVTSGTADELGNFIEATEFGGVPQPGIHNASHGAISDFEHLPGNSDADMDDLAQAPHNEYFWHLHGWIDGLFADWQRNHGEAVDQSPMQPMDMGVTHPLVALSSVLEPAEIAQNRARFSRIIRAAR